MVALNPPHGQSWCDGGDIPLAQHVATQSRKRRLRLPGVSMHAAPASHRPSQLRGPAHVEFLHLTRPCYSCMGHRKLCPFVLAVAETVVA